MRMGPTHVVPGPRPHSLLGLLPGIYSDDPLACRLVDAFDDALAPILLSLDNFASYLDPGVAPADFVTWLGSWVAAVDTAELSDDRRRALVASAVEMHAWRGTRRGLCVLVELVTGVTPEIEESGGVAAGADPGNTAPGDDEAGILVRMRTSDPGDVDTRTLDLLVALTCPAHVPYRIELVPTVPGGAS